jgi:hypothetical protein
MSRWPQKVWEPNGHHSSPAREPLSSYEMLCRAAHVRGLHVELVCEAGEPVELRLSKDMRAVLYSIEDRERAALELCIRLVREVSR